jgi:hypothetical protein
LVEQLPQADILLHKTWVNQRKRHISWPSRLHHKLGKCRETVVSHKEKHILAVPPGNAVILPKDIPEAIHTSVPMRSEQGAPVTGPLLVYMMRAALVWNCRREEYDIAVPGERVDKYSGLFWWQMLSNLH